MSDLTPSFQNLTISDDKLLFSETKLTVEQQALAAQWTNLVSTIQQDSSFFSKLNDSLRHTTYVLGNEPSNTDIVVFKSIFPVLESAGDKLNDEKYIAEHRHIIRWIDLVQNTLVKLTDAEKLKIPYDAKIPAEVTQKPKKDAKKGGASGKEAAPEAAAATAAAAAAPAAGGKPKGKPSPEELAKLKEEKAKAKAAKKSAAQNDAAKKEEAAAPVPSQIDLRVGFIEKAIKHPNADSLYVSTINLGEEEPRTICSGLVKYYPLEAMQKRYVVVVCNLKKVKMRGIDSLGMVLCSSDESKVEFVNPPEGSQPGDKVFFEGYDGEPEKVLNPKKKIWETVQPKLTTNEDFTVVYKADDGKVFKLVNKKGQEFRASSIVAARVS